MTSLESLLRRELRSTMLFIGLGFSTVLALVLAIAMSVEVRSEHRFIESFVLESSKNVLIYEDPIMLQRSVAEFWKALSGRDSSLAGMNVYLGDSWVAEVGERPRFALTYEKDFEAVPGKKLHLETLFSLVPFLFRLGLAWAIVGGCSLAIYIFRWRELAVKMRDLEALRGRQAAAEARELLAAQVAHDIRSPLGFLNIILQRPEQIDANAESVKKALSRLNEIAQDLLRDFRDSGKAIEVISVGQLIREVIDEKRSACNDFDFEFKDAKVSALGSGPEFKRLLSNLLNNSIEACKTGGRVKTSCKQFGEHAIIVIEDNGPGMPPEILAKAGEKGFTYGKGGGAGTGLGLFSAKRSVEKWGGEFKIESSPGKGTRISLSLPRG